MGELIDFDTLTHTNGAAPLGASPPPRLRAIRLEDFLRMEFPPRRMLDAFKQRMLRRAIATPLYNQRPSFLTDVRPAAVAD